jgi:hypothetical protein
MDQACEGEDKAVRVEGGGACPPTVSESYACLSALYEEHCTIGRLNRRGLHHV